MSDAYIESAVHDVLSKTSFNSTTDIARWLNRIDIDVESVEKYFPALEKGIIRRHKIVHEADMSYETGKPTPFTKSELRKFTVATGATIVGIMSQMRGQSNVAEKHENLGEHIKALLKDERN